MKIPRSPRSSILALPLGLLGLAVLAAHTSAQTTINSVPYTINAPGKYQLAGNLNNNSVDVPAIAISAPNVILDLKGYYVAGPGNPALTGTANSVILVGNFANVTVKNGTIAGGAYGIRYLANNAPTTSRNYVVDTVTITRCYLAGLYWGVTRAPGSLVRNCSFSTIGNSTSTANTSPSAIYTSGGIRMENNNIGEVTATGTGESFGINGDLGDFSIGNTIANCTYAITRGKYLNDLTYNVTTPFAGGTSATGNN